MSSVSVKLPEPDDLDYAFYKACADSGALTIQECRACGQRTHPARYYCPRCTSDQYHFKPVSGRATVHSYTVSHFSVEAAWRDRVPYVTLVAELAEGPRVLARTDTIKPESISIGMPIKLELQTLAPEFSFVIATAAEAES